MGSVDPMRHWIAFWDYLDDNFWHVWAWGAQNLTPEEVSWRPVAGVASFGWNLMHLGEMLDYYLSAVFEVAEPVQKQLVTMARGAQDDGRFSDLQRVAAYHRVVRPRYRSFLTQLHVEDLERSLAQGRFTLGWAIAHVHEHESYHLGKCTLLRTLILDRRRASRGKA